MKVEHLGNRGFVTNEGQGVLTYELLNASNQAEISEERDEYGDYIGINNTVKIGPYSIASYGDQNNLPTELKLLVRQNHLLPEILKKQVRFLYGQGPFLYKTEFEGDRRIRKPVTSNYSTVTNWLNSWTANGLPHSIEDYLKLVITEYYYTEGIFTRFHMNKSRRTNGERPIRGLEFKSSIKCRLGYEGNPEPNELLEDSQLDKILVGRWGLFSHQDYEVYDRFDSAQPLKSAIAINYTRDFGFGEEIYSYPTWYYGLREWIKGSNLNPKYINSYLKNSLNAKLHVIIPDIWFTQKEGELQAVCQENQNRKELGKPLIEKWDGVEVGITYSKTMLLALMDKKLTDITTVLSGEGKNQGKLFASRSFRDENGVAEWEFKDIPTKYKEFITSIIEYSKRSDAIILEGKGLSPSISGVSSEGAFGGSGSDTYYNYLIYLNSLTYAEEFCTEDINTALWINFPFLRRDNVRLGFFRRIPERQEELKPQDRITASTTL